MPEYSKDGSDLATVTASLWDILVNAVQDPEAGSVIMVLDALDECTELDLEVLAQKLKRFFFREIRQSGRVRFLLTGRPYEHVVSPFNELVAVFPYIRILGENESEDSSREVNFVINLRVRQLAIEKPLSPEIEQFLRQRLTRIRHRTYLWVYLVFTFLKSGAYRKTQKSIESAIATLPESVNQAYEQILNNSKDEEMARKALSIILAAYRPLTLSEMNVAMSANISMRSIEDLDLEPEEDFKFNLRSWCGLFVSVHHNKVYFLHQTAREFLLTDLAAPATLRSELRWRRSIAARDAHAILSRACIAYLELYNDVDIAPPGGNDEEDDIYDYGEVDDGIDNYEETNNSIGDFAFLNYSAENWSAHVHDACIDDNVTISSIMSICDPECRSVSVWFKVFWEFACWGEAPDGITSLIMASIFGHKAVVQQLLMKGPNIETRDISFGRTPLLWAAEYGHTAVVQQLLAKGANIEARDTSNVQTPLISDARRGHKAVAQLLLTKGADIEARDHDGRTPLLLATFYRQEAIMQLLLANGADIEAKGRNDQTPLSLATSHGQEAVVGHLESARAARSL